MPVYRQYNYVKVRDCYTCQFYRNSKCHQPIPNKFNCNIITKKEFTHKYFFKTSIQGRIIIHRGYATKKAAREAEQCLLNEILVKKENRTQEKHLPSYIQLLNEYKSFIKENFKITYYTKMRLIIDSFYSTLYPDVPVDLLTKMDTENARKKILNKKVATDTKNGYVNFLKRFFRWVYDYYNYEYRDILLVPKIKDYQIHHLKKKHPIVELSEFQKIYRSCDSDYFRLALLTLFLFGLRLGEQLGLAVDSFDFLNNTLEIYQEVSFKSQKGFILVSPKTTASKRLLKMPKLYVDMVKKHINIHHLKKKDFIFFRLPDKHDIPIYENTFRRHLQKYCNAYQPDFHPHMLRSSICTHLIEKGTTLEEVSKYLGHSDTRVTDEYYLKTSNKKEEELMKVLNQIIDETIKNESKKDP